MSLQDFALFVCCFFPFGFCGSYSLVVLSPFLLGACGLLGSGSIPLAVCFVGSIDRVMARNTSGGIYRMGVLVDQLVEERQYQPFNWNLSVVGSFFGPNPPAISVVQQVVDVH